VGSLGRVGCPGQEFWAELGTIKEKDDSAVLNMPERNRFIFLQQGISMLEVLSGRIFE
jgi:hypothetical protein